MEFPLARVDSFDPRAVATLAGATPVWPLSKVHKLLALHGMRVEDYRIQHIVMALNDSSEEPTMIPDP